MISIGLDYLTREMENVFDELLKEESCLHFLNRFTIRCAF